MGKKKSHLWEIERDKEKEKVEELIFIGNNFF